MYLCHGFPIPRVKRNRINGIKGENVRFVISRWGEGKFSKLSILVKFEKATQG